MKTILGLLKIAWVGVLMLGVLAVGLVLAPTALRGQGVRERPFTEIRTHLMGGSAIGASLRDVDNADVTREKLSTQAGAVVEEVDQDGPAAKAGFRAGDIVVTFDGEKIRSARQLSRLIEETPDGREVTASVVRAGESVNLKVTPEASHGFGAYAPFRDFNFSWPEGRSFQFSRPMPDPNPDLEPRVFGPDRYSFVPSRRGRLGVEVQGLTEQLGQYFGTTTGVLIANVTEDSPAKTAGLKAGDVITKVDGRSVRDANDLTRFISQASSEITLTIVRDRREQTVKATLSREDRERPRTIIK
jgi:serine protease Do